MKKLMIVALLATGVQTFSCSFMKNPDTLIERVIKKVQAEKKSDEIFCDSDDLKMLYYLIQGEDYNLNLGVSIDIDETTTNNQFKNRFYQKLEEYKKFIQTIDRKNLGKLPLPDKEVVRFYAKIANTDKFFIIGKYEYDRKNNTYTFYASSTGKELFENIGLFSGMNVKYTDEIVY